MAKLQQTLENKVFDVVALLTTIDEEQLKSTIHAIPLELLLRQA